MAPLVSAIADALDTYVHGIYKKEHTTKAEGMYLNDNVCRIGINRVVFSG
jgi:hypothetical protein